MRACATNCMSGICVRERQRKGERDIYSGSNNYLIPCVRICVFHPVIVSVLLKFQSVSRMRVTSQNPCVRNACFS